jgi:hypothetical protein
LDHGVLSPRSYLAAALVSAAVGGYGTADGRAVRIWHVTLPVDPTREAVSFTSPATANLKVFALSTRA